MSIRIVIVFLLIAGLGGAGSTFGQSRSESARPSRAAYYNFTEPGDVTILVHVWGNVSNPGLYEVPRGIHLDKLFSLAGGPAIKSRSRWTRRTLTVQVQRKNSGELITVYKTSMQDEVIVPDENPVLKDGDYVTAETYSRTPLWREVVSLVGSTASVALVVERLLF